MREAGKQGKASFYGRKAALSELHVSEEPGTGLIKWQEVLQGGTRGGSDAVRLCAASPCLLYRQIRLPRGDAGSVAPWTALGRWPQSYGGDFLLSRDPQGF